MLTRRSGRRVLAWLLLMAAPASRVQMYVGYGDDRELSELNRLEKADRSFFVKMSYAFQR
jgi:hypothetical protein